MNTEQNTLLNKLTSLQQLVALGIIAGKTPIDAYFEAGGTAISRKAARGQVSKMRKSVKFSAFMSSISEAKVGEAVATRTEVLVKLSDIAMNSKNDMASIAAIGRLATMQGWYPPKKNMDIPAPPGVASRFSQEDYEEADRFVDEHFQTRDLSDEQLNEGLGRLGLLPKARQLRAV